MEVPLQYEEAAQCIGLSPSGSRSHRPDGPKTGHALTFNPDHSSGADHYNEFVSYTDVEKLFACPVDPSTDLSINIDQFYRVDKVPKTVQEQENRQALLRVTLALLHEPLRLYKGASGEVPSLRVAELHDFVHSDSKFGVLEALRKSVFHVPRDHLDEDGLNVQFSSLSISTLDLFEPLLGFYQECPDPE